MSAPASPTRIGLYINSFRISATDTSPYTNLLGTDGLGANPAGGNKIDDLITYMVNEGYTYGIFYGLDGTAFINSSSDEVFTATGISRLKNIIGRFTAAGLECSAVVNLASLNRTVSRWDGTSQVRKIVNYNNAYAFAGERFTSITVETEFWNFAHTSPLTSPSKIEVTSGRTMAENLWPGPPDPATCGNTTVPTISLSPSVSSHDYVKIINSGGAFVYREIVNRDTSSAPLFSIEFDRPLPTAFPDGSCVYYRTVLNQDAPDYQTFKYRATNCRAYLNANDTTGMEFELYSGFPDYVNDGNSQLANLYGHSTNPVFDRILLTNYHRIPNWDYVNGGTQNRVTQDILPGIDTPRTIGFIVSAESPTLNARGCDDPVANFSGYFLEGRSLNSYPTVPLSSLFRPSNSATGGTEITNTNYCGGNCCAPNTVFEPTLGTYDPRTIEDCWDYTLTAAPTGAGYCPPNGDTYNEDVTSGAVSPVLDARANWDTIVVFTQSLIRQLNPVSEFTFTATPINPSCTGDDGSIQIVITGGTGPYDIYVDGSPVVTAVTSPYTLTGYATGTYSIDVYDSTATLASNSPQSVTLASIGGILGTYDTQYPVNQCSTSLICPVLDTPFVSITGSQIFVKVISDPVGTYDSGFVPYVTGTLDLCSLGLTIPGDGTAYNIVAQTAEGCTLLLPVGPFFPTNPLDITYTKILPLCYSGNDSTGSIININLVGPTFFDPTGFTMTVSGPVTQTAPYTPGMNFTGLPIGTYTLTATGPNPPGCSAIETPIKLSPADKDPLTITITKQVDPVCSYICNGSAEVLATGGKGPYIYSWSNGQFGPEATGLCPTTYTVTVEDDNKCTASLTIDLSGSSTPIEFTYRLYNIPVGQTTGGAIYIDSVTGAGGAPYTYSWVGPNGFTATTDDITDLEAGTYTVTICSEGGGLNTGECCLTQSFVIGQQCIDFTLEELKVILFKAQCCAGYLAKEYVQYQEIGRPDLAECKLVDLKYLTLAINALSCINELPDSCLSCEDISNIVNQIKKLCDCDCCDDAATATYNVTYNPVTGQLDSNSSIN